MKVTLSEEEFELLSMQLLPLNSRHKVQSVSPQRSGSYIIEVSASEADEIRDLAGELLQRRGFDENYSPTSLGRIAESIIDKFYEP
jgi:hypothetical protein